MRPTIRPLPRQQYQAGGRKRPFPCIVPRSPIPRRRATLQCAKQQGVPKIRNGLRSPRIKAGGGTRCFAAEARTASRGIAMFLERNARHICRSRKQRRRRQQNLETYHRHRAPRHTSGVNAIVATILASPGRRGNQNSHGSIRSNYASHESAASPVGAEEAAAEVHRRTIMPKQNCGGEPHDPIGNRRRQRSSRRPMARDVVGGHQRSTAGSATRIPLTHALSLSKAAFRRIIHG